MAERLGLELLARLRVQGKAREQGILTFGELWSRFSRECATWLENGESTKRDDEARANILLSHFGDSCDVRALTPNDVAAYAVRRRTDGIPIIDRRGESMTHAQCDRARSNVT
jgi:hypothetical protein